MKILYISQYFPPEMGAPAARVSELARHWVRAGHEVTVLTGFPNHPTGVLAPEYRAKLWRFICKETFNGVKVVRTWLLPLPNRKTHERILNYISFCNSAAVTGTFLSRPDVVIATSPQLLVPLAGWWVSRIKRVPLVFEVRDLWPESLGGVGIAPQQSLMQRSLGGLARFLYRKAEHIVVVTPAFKERIVADWGIDPQKVSLVENGVETDLFSPGGLPGEMQGKLGLGGKFVVSYIGTMGNAHGLDALLAAADRLRARPEIAFLMVGEGAEKQRLMEQARERGLANLRFLPQQPREQIPAFICASDVCLVLLKKADVFTTVIPTKMLEFMSCARPVILGVEGQARSVLEQAGSGIAIEPENPGALVEAIVRLSQDAELRAALGRNGRAHIVAHLSRQRTARIYADLLQRLAGNAYNTADAGGH